MDAVEFKNVSFRYPDAEKFALKDISFNVGCGEFVLLCGPSGSGKSTLLRLIKRQLSPFGERAGEISVLGKRTEDLTEGESVSEVGFVMQSCNAQIVTESVRRELAFGAESLGWSSGEIRRAVAETALYFGLDKLYNSKTSELSGGERQLLNLAGVMVCKPEILLLDEPTAQLDPIAAKNLIAHILRLHREMGITIIVSEHNTDDVFALADRVLALDNGRLAADTSPRKAITNEAVFFGALPVVAQLSRRLGISGDSAALTTAECRRLLRGKITESLPPPKEKAHVDSAEAAVKIRDVFFRYGKKSPDILSGASLDIYKGEILSILGGNGAGKTTLLRLISGLEKPYAGKILAGDLRKKEYSGKLYSALLPQNPRELFLLSTVKDELSAAVQRVCKAEDAAEKKVRELAKLFQLESLLSRHPYDLSGGEQQKAALAKLLAIEPQLLLLDEPTKGMDYDSRQGFVSLIKNLSSRGLTIVMVTHDVRTAAACSDRCALLFDGAIVSCDTPSRFFSGMNYLTTPEAHIARGIVPGAVTLDDLTAAFEWDSCGGALS